MKKKKNGFAATGVLYTILVIFLILMSTLLVTLSSRSRILSKLKSDAKNVSTTVFPTLYNIKNGSATATGALSNPYYINSIEDLVLLSIDVNNGINYENKNLFLLRDLDFQNNASYLDSSSKVYGDINGDGIVGTIYEELTTSSGFIPIGNSSNAFRGTFNGNKKIIRNLLIHRDAPYQGMFGNNEGNIEHLTIHGNIQGIYRVGGISSINSGNIRDCHNQAFIQLKLVANYANNDTTYFGGTVGGIAGQNTGEISNSSNIGSISSVYNPNSNDNGYIGGLVGRSTAGQILDCFNSGEVIGTSTRDTITGGVVGANYETSVVGNCYNTNAITSTTTNAISYSGGIVGLNRSSVSNTYNIGSILSSGSQNKCLSYNEKTINNSFYLNTCTLGGEGISKTSEEIKGLTNILGDAFKDDINQINNGYPILKWQ